MSCSGRAGQVIFCLLILKLYCQLTVSQLCPKDESYALLQLKDGFEYDESASLDCSPPYHRMASWKSGTDCCSWDGVACHGVTGHVIALDLSCSGLRGNLSSNSSLFHLSHLRRLNLAFNYFNRSSIPPEFGMFSSLTHLNLSSTWFSGQVPTEISHLSKLISLDLSLNEPLILEAPAMKMIVQNLTLVREIFLDYINMSSVDLGSLMNLSSSLTSLSLALCGLQGQFPENIFHLPNLQLLNLLLNSDLYGHLPVSNWSSSLELLKLGSTSFSGGLPDIIGNLDSIKVLDLGNCAFHGSVPASLGNLRQLNELDLSNNNWTGQIPDVFGNLSKLNSLSLQIGSFSGMLPSSVFNLTELLRLDLSQNQLEGTLPDHICGLDNVTYLDLSYNLLSGTIPSCLFGLPSLVWFNLNNNHLTGELGEHWSKSLQEIRLESNKINGLIPPSISELVNLTNFDVSSNNLSGIVDLNLFSNMKNLWGLDLSHNSLSVVTNNNRNSTWPQFYKLALSSCNIIEFPDFLKIQNQLNFLSLSHNRIHGEIPKWLSAKGMQSLQYLDLSHNFLTIVNELPPSLQYLDLTSNLLQQPFPILPQSMYILLIANNKLTGEIPPWICNITTFQIINLSNNSLSGNIPQCLGNFSTELSVLNLRSNSFHGTIPGSFTEGNKIRSLDLNGNELEGSLPLSLANCKMLEVLDLGNNYINDSFPLWLQTLPKLQVLVLRSNRLHGSIGNPTVISPFSSLRIIDLSHNDFIGLLPTQYIANFQAMKKVDGEVKATPKYIGEIYYQDSIVLTMKGTEIPMERILTIFTTMDLSSNRFEGQIPKEVGLLSSLLVLNISRNSVTGEIPSSLGNLTALESLDLSSNGLGGGIPSQLTRLTFLAVLNLSYNQLVGPIPHGSQFDTFQNDSYVGNLRLCGFPLSVKCSGDVAPQPPPFQEKEDPASLFNWKFAMIGYGCGLVIGLSMGYIVFTTGKPQWFVRKVEVEQKKWLRRRTKRNI
ncbi:receptor-like protein 7 [Populus nigra]|uniref:receptor-like protein 7 n=1 Tax=Populus nigra TaxID=3691 RepID=UPI002B278C03|nr:receptor-like protein 7 [Populus nigra]